MYFHHLFFLSPLCFTYQFSTKKNFKNWNDNLKNITKSSGLISLTFVIHMGLTQFVSFALTSKRTQNESKTEGMWLVSPLLIKPKHHDCEVILCHSVTIEVKFP